MEMMDTFSKYDLQLDSSCKRTETMLFASAKELNKPNEKITMETQKRGAKKELMSVHEYLKTFQWDSTRFQVDKSLKVIGAKISGYQKSNDEKLKKIMDEQNDIKNKLAALVKKDSKSYMIKDLGELVYEKKISSQWFVNTFGSKIMTSVLVVVPKKQVDRFQETYPIVYLEHNKKDLENWMRRTLANIQHANQNIEDEGQRKAIINEEFEHAKMKHEKEIELPGVVPMSSKYLDLEDPDGNQLWRITAMTDHVSGYLRVLKKAGFQCQEFTFDSDAYSANKNLESQLKNDLRTSNEKLYNKCKKSFEELFTALVHLKIMRTYVDGVLRFGIPPNFLLGIIKPSNSKAEERVKHKLTEAFSEAHLMGMYGQKEEA